MFFNINNKNTILTLKEKESETNFSLMESFENSSIRSQYPIDASYYNGTTPNEFQNKTSIEYQCMQSIL